MLLGHARFQILLDHFSFERFAVARLELAILVVLALDFHGSLFCVNPFQDESIARLVPRLYMDGKPGEILDRVFRQIEANQRFGVAAIGFDDGVVGHVQKFYGVGISR